MYCNFVKKMVALLLSLVMGFLLCGCSSDAMKAYEAAVAALPNEISYDDWDAIECALDAYVELSDREKSKVDRAAVDSAKEKFCALPIVSDCAYLKSRVANPDSMKIFGDVTQYTIHKKDGTILFFTCVHFDSLNANAVYSGETRAEIGSDTAGNRGMAIQGSKSFTGLEDISKNTTIEQLADLGVDVFTISGQTVASALGCEYVS